MGEHLVLCVDRLGRRSNVEVGSEDVITLPIGGGERPSSVVEERDVDMDVGCGEDVPLIQMAECRICQEEDGIGDLEVPCACSGSVKYAHRKCVQRWCNEKGDIICEICHQAYQPGYTAPPQLPPSEDTIIDFGGWTIAGTPLELHDPRLLAIAEAERQFLEAEYEDYAASNASGAAFFRSAALILMALLLLRHLLTIPDANEDDDASTLFSLFVLRAAGFLLPCYIMAWAISILQRRRQRQVKLCNISAQPFAALSSTCGNSWGNVSTPKVLA